MKINAIALAAAFAIAAPAAAETIIVSDEDGPVAAATLSATLHMATATRAHDQNPRLLKELEEGDDGVWRAVIWLPNKGDLLS